MRSNYKVKVKNDDKRLTSRSVVGIGEANKNPKKKEKKTKDNLLMLPSIF